jgi:hypothetical protein
VDVLIEQLLAAEFDAVRDTDIADISAGPRRMDGLHHRLLRTHALQHRVRADALGQLHYPLDALITALDNDICCPEFACESLALFVPAHRNNAIGAHLLGRQNPEESDRTVANDCDGCARLYIEHQEFAPQKSN